VSAIATKGGAEALLQGLGQRHPVARWAPVSLSSGQIPPAGDGLAKGVTGRDDPASITLAPSRRHVLLGAAAAVAIPATTSLTANEGLPYLTPLT
jgi:hypothetical protein